MPLASRRDRLCEGSKASTEWSVAKHQGNIANRLYQGFVDFDCRTHGNTAEQIMSM
jgi:hypothetical protein